MTRTANRRAALATTAVLAASVTLAACDAGASSSGSSKSFKAADCKAAPTGTFAQPPSGGPGGKHTVKTFMGDVEVPNSPKRVVVLDTAELDSAITLGVKPVGATRADVESGFLDYLPEDKVGGIKDVGVIASPNMEAVAALKPDLILTSKVRDGQRYEQLKAIAPTVMTETTGYPWKENFTTHADALGRIPEAKKVTAAYEAHAEKVDKALSGNAATKNLTTNVVRFIEGADTRVYGCESYVSSVLNDAGLAPTDFVEGAKDGLMVEVSPEQINKADSGTVFYTSYGSKEKSREGRITGGALWKNMTAVKDGKSFRVDDQLWIQGIGYTAADKILDEVQKRLAKR
ncbi:iron-siderophore ABC transporter substrate-binding protein [Streptomyces sp. NPDC050636]|uniref:ABC transporter substrate-binding protein n=1 Tax=Streptomyces sp. NPDC050636 TaxID=3154510 RepID=UPI003423D40D